MFSVQGFKTETESPRVSKNPKNYARSNGRPRLIPSALWMRFFSQKTCFLISVWRNSVSVSLYYQRFFVKESTFQLLTVYLFWARLLIWGLGKLEVLRRFQTTYIWTRVSTGRPGTNREGMSHCPFVPGLKKFLSRLPFAPGQWQELMSRDIPGQNRFPKRTKKTGKGRSKIGKWPDFLFQNIIFLF